MQLVHCWCRAGCRLTLNPLHSILDPCQRIEHRHSVALKMAADLPSKRPVCLSCSKPVRLCLCTRMKTPIIDNSIAVTILQHKLEKNHPLNSTRIATIGLKNLNRAWISDISVKAEFYIESMQPHCEAQMNITVEKHGRMSAGSQNHDSENYKKGFLVQKFARHDLIGTSASEGSKEFEIAVPCGSVLLFPSKESVRVEDIDFDVKNLIVLDGTWAKAKRMYSENPWLKMLPHVKLDMEKLSLYGEVRTQPKAGYLSSIESIVYALKAFGENADDLDGLLDVFASMVCDQRRCKDERLSNTNGCSTENDV